jgi:hypothetical protein
LIQAPGDANRAGAIFGIRKPKTTGRIGRKNGSNPAPHREIPVKLTAWVDADVAPLVMALDGIADVMTLDSCQGGPDTPAYVFFRHRGDGRKAALFAAELAAVLSPHEAAADYVLTAEWRPGADEPVFRLVCPTTHANRLASVLSEAWG